MIFGLAIASGLLAWWLAGRLAQPDFPLFSLDHPNERSLHHVPTPRTGGVAMLGAFYVGILSLQVISVLPSSPIESKYVIEPTGWWILGATGVIAITSFLDDRRGLPVGMRFGLHVGAAVLLVIGSRVKLPLIEIPIAGPMTLGWLAVPVTVILIVWMTNLYNFMDGMDGFAGGMTLLGGGFLASLAWRGQHSLIFVVSLFLATAALGFLVYNFPPAKIFLGDVGSVPAGFMLGSLMILGCRDRLFTVWVPLILFSPFILDATVTLLRRALQGERVWRAHRSHYYQRIVLLGWGHRKTVLAEYGLMMLCGAMAWAYHVADDSVRPAILGFWALLMLSLMLGVHVAEHMALSRKPTK
jgi:UDP-N-acetylmuramyl pentapeptide phosphotransferase/UDP-N-acetylglucosamine-1-phosphate transferase